MQSKRRDMTLKQISKALGYKTIKEMLPVHGYTKQGLDSVKRLNPRRYDMILSDMVLKHYKIDHEELVKMVELYKVHSSTIEDKEQ